MTHLFKESERLFAAGNLLEETSQVRDPHCQFRTAGLTRVGRQNFINSDLFSQKQCMRRCTNLWELGGPGRH